MHFRTHLLTPVSSSGRTRWVNLESPDEASAPFPASLRAAAPAPSPSRHASIATLERPVDLVVLVIADRREATITSALAMLPDPLPCAVILAEATTAAADGPCQELTSIAGVPGITEAGHEEILIPGHVWVAPRNRVLTLARRGNAVHTLVLAPAAIDGAGSLDTLLRSAAESFGARTLVVLLGGATADGREGCRQVRAAGGRIIQATPEPDVDRPRATASTKDPIAHGSWPRADLAPIVRDCIAHGRHDPRRPTPS